MIKYQTDRRCIRCRLKKCLSMGMRKDFILGQQRRKQSEKNESISNTEFDEIDQVSFSHMLIIKIFIFIFCL